jgi:hypothetical protein
MVTKKLVMQAVQNDDVNKIENFYNAGEMNENLITLAICKALVHNKPKCEAYLTERMRENSIIKGLMI